MGATARELYERIGMQIAPKKPLVYKSEWLGKQFIYPISPYHVQTNESGYRPGDRRACTRYTRTKCEHAFYLPNNEDISVSQGALTVGERMQDTILDAEKERDFSAKKGEGVHSQPIGTPSETLYAPFY